MFFGFYINVVFLFSFSWSLKRHYGPTSNKTFLKLEKDIAKIVLN